MRVEKFIESAIEKEWQGWREVAGHMQDMPVIISLVKKHMLYETLLDPKAFEAVGKVEGWGKGKEDKVCLHENPEASDDGICDLCFKKAWEKRMNGLTPALIKGKSIKEYIETL